MTFKGQTQHLPWETHSKGQMQFLSHEHPPETSTLWALGMESPSIQGCPKDLWHQADLI